MEHIDKRAQYRIAALVMDAWDARPRCRCCGGVLGAVDDVSQAYRDGIGLHTRCSIEHWDRHTVGLAASRCRDYGAA